MLSPIHLGGVEVCGELEVLIASAQGVGVGREKIAVGVTR